jgi:hypothetical protein
MNDSGSFCTCTVLVQSMLLIAICVLETACSYDVCVLLPPGVCYALLCEVKCYDGLFSRVTLLCSVS